MSEEIEFEEINNQNESIDDNDYDEVLSLTEFDGGLMGSNSNQMIVAEYDNIDIFKIEQKHKIEAKSFVSKITKFITSMNDAELTEDHHKYLKQVGSFQIEHLTDLLTLVDINKQMINNIVKRVNSVQAEDYAMIATYNTLLNQHLKIVKEVQNIQKSLPAYFKKMKTEVLCNQELGDLEQNQDLISENFGETQFNNQKQLLKKLKEDYEENGND